MQSLENETTHRFGRNSFKLHRLPTPRPNQVLGLVGTNGIGKSTALKGNKSSVDDCYDPCWQAEAQSW